MNQFFLSIGRIDGQPVLLKPDSVGEHDFVKAIMRRVTNVGLFRTEAEVKRIVERAVQAALMDAKSDVFPGY